MQWASKRYVFSGRRGHWTGCKTEEMSDRSRLALVIRGNQRNSLASWNNLEEASSAIAGPIGRLSANLSRAVRPLGRTTNWLLKHFNWKRILTWHRDNDSYTSVKSVTKDICAHLGFYAAKNCIILSTFRNNLSGPLKMWPIGCP